MVLKVSSSERYECFTLPPRQITFPQINYVALSLLSSSIMTRQTAETVVWRVPGPGTAGELSAASENPLPVITRRLTAANPRQLVSISQTPDGSFFVPYGSATIPEGQACSYT